MDREDVFEHVEKQYGTKPEYTFKDFPEYATLKHGSDGKWYGLVMNVPEDKLGLDGEEEVDILNLKSPTELNGSLRKRRDILPAYHMNKEHWISIILERAEKKEDVYEMIETSFNLTGD